jgi:4'-phosphopantetheinyl transferase EntD
MIDDHSRRTISPFGRRGYYLTRSPVHLRDVVVSDALPRVHLVTPAFVSSTIARHGAHGVRGVLTDAELATFDALPVERRRRDWLAGRLAAKRALRAAIRKRGQPMPDYRAIELWNDADGAPRFFMARMPELGHHLDISLSHTDGAAVASVADRHASGTVGVDIETTRALPMALVSRVLQPSEAARLADGPHPAPIVMWTAKEAVLKAAHAICTALRDVELTWSGARVVHARVVDDAHRAILVGHHSVGPYTVAVALCR